TMDTIVKLKGLNVYQEDKLILEQVNLTVEKGNLVYFIGKVGSGKSSLLKTLYVELPITEGEVEVCGFDLKTLKRNHRNKLRKKLGIVFQDFQLLTDRNIYENLHFVLKATGWKKKNEIDQRINEVLERVKLPDKIFSMPHQLSGGEQQRVAIARALINRPEIIIADEPTAHLDSKLTAELLSVLSRLKEDGKTIIIATHDPSVYQHDLIDRPFVMHDGSLVEVARP
ncbi:MAG: ATP-binding cassette domain-containing protein, partial [Geopsychrobacter sp.]|nr:ATP-binding cassette domain-containing protein [Geopsychrobacter sp.]